MTTPTLLPDVDSQNPNFILVETLDASLDAVINAYANAGVPLPERRYWALGAVAGDAEQLAISLIQAYVGVPNEQVPNAGRCDGPRTITYTIQVLRCIPTIDSRGNPPSAESIQTASARQAIDMWLLLDSATAIADLAPAIATVDAGEPQGGFQGVTMTITQQVM